MNALQCMLKLVVQSTWIAMASSSRGAESPGGASEHTAGLAGDRLSLEDAIARLKDREKTDELGSQIVAAAITLRDSSGRDRKQALRLELGKCRDMRRLMMVNGKTAHLMPWRKT